MRGNVKHLLWEGIKRKEGEINAKEREIWSEGKEWCSAVPRTTNANGPTGRQPNGRIPAFQFPFGIVELDSKLPMPFFYCSFLLSLLQLVDTVLLLFVIR